MVEKLNEFLFDILGLIIPGLVFLALIILLPLLIIDSNLANYFKDIINDTSFVFFVGLIVNDKTLFDVLSSMSFIFTILLISYILGHMIKVLSKLQYDICERIFDKGFNKIHIFYSEKIKDMSKKSDNFFLKLSNYKKRQRILKENNCNVCFLIRIVFGIWDSVVQIVKILFTFGAADNCDQKMEKLVREEVYSTFSFKSDNWYSLYKISNIIIAQENLKDFSSKFLAKYNFYRSMAFIFLLNYIYIFVLFKFANQFINQIGEILYYPIMFLNFLLWFTFHEKFKRYWTLCGNENLFTLFYFLKIKRKEKK